MNQRTTHEIEVARESSQVTDDGRWMRLIENVERWFSPAPCVDPVAMQAWIAMMSTR